MPRKTTRFRKSERIGTAGTQPEQGTLAMKNVCTQVGPTPQQNCKTSCVAATNTTIARSNYALYSATVRVGSPPDSPASSGGSCL
jgi:hypothetical protein